MQPEEVLEKVRDTLTVRRVFGEPYERDGTLVVPVAQVRGGGGGGSGTGPSENGQWQGEGAGFGMDARPVGVYVIRDGQVSWQPAVDVTRIVLRGQLIAVVAILLVRSVVKRLTRR